MIERGLIALRKCDLFDRVYETTIRLTPLEQEIINAEIFMRLKEIKQLGLAYLIYPNAGHSRLEHSLGTMYLAGKAAKSLELSEEDAQYFRLAALLHDVGHGPFSHAFEDYLRENKKICGHEDLTKWAILNSEIKDIIDHSTFDLRKVADLSVGKIKDEKISFLNSLILGVIDVDKMDFLVRDAHYIERKNKELDVKRLASSVKRVNEGKVAWDYQYLNLLEMFFQFKNDMYRSVYYSKEVRATDVMIKAMLKFSDAHCNWFPFKEIEDLKKLTDFYVLGKMKKAISHSKPVSTEMGIAVRLYEDLLKKNLLKNVFEKIYFAHNLPCKDFIANAEEILSELEGSLNVDRRLVFVDVLHFSPGSVMSFIKTDKAEVYVLRNGDVLDAKEFLKRLLSASYQVIRVYVASEYVKKLREIREIVKKTINNLFIGR